MAMHAPAIRPHVNVPTLPNLWPATVAVVLVGLLAAAALLIQPSTAPAVKENVWLTRDRQEEIGANHTEPDIGIIQFRHGEFAGN
jgi:hypothetical protein